MILIVLPLNSGWLIPSVYYYTFHFAQVTLYAIINISYCSSNDQILLSVQKVIENLLSLFWLMYSPVILTT